MVLLLFFFFFLANQTRGDCFEGLFICLYDWFVFCLLWLLRELGKIYVTCNLDD